MQREKSLTEFNEFNKETKISSLIPAYWNEWPRGSL